MAKTDKLIQKILQGRSDASIGFEELRSLLKSLGFEERIRGSHHIFRRAAVEERVNLQREDSKAKPYQVRQVRAVILKYRLGGDNDA
jgi:predicted RNA binding protein YcfA (HicA-like mRNA interferase family)